MHPGSHHNLLFFIVLLGYFDVFGQTGTALALVITDQLETRLVYRETIFQDCECAHGTERKVLATSLGHAVRY